METEADDCDAGYACEDFGELEFQVRDTLIWRGDLIPISEREVQLAENGERFRAGHERYEDRERCHAARSDGECIAPTCPQLQDGEPAKTGRHCPLDTWRDDDE